MVELIERDEVNFRLFLIYCGGDIMRLEEWCVFFWNDEKYMVVDV